MRRTDFSWALDEMKLDKKLTRLGWNGAGQWVAMADSDFPDDLPYLFMKNAQDKFVPWVPSQGDLFADDWVLVEE